VRNAVIKRRASGILLHVSSLPSPYGVGDLGPQAYAWVDFLVAAGQSFWQILPLGPTTALGHHSPYRVASAFGGNPLFISPEALRDQGLLTDGDLAGFPSLPEDRVDYPEAAGRKRRLLDLAYDRFVARAGTGAVAFEAYCTRNASWLDDYALFAALREQHAVEEWAQWPASLRGREAADLEAARVRLGREIEQEKFFQYLFFEQWSRLKGYANARGVQIIGDLPFYVGGDSADVWANPSLFKLDEAGRPTAVAGVPPDAFSATGQLWGNPVYDWDAHARAGYQWWIARTRKTLELVDVARIDHFRGFAAYWAVPAGDETAAGGEWVDGPGDAFFQALLKHWPFPPLIAEDLGLITADVRELRARYDLPGMSVLLFAFDGGASNPYALHNHRPDAVLYTGTHDNNTVRGWFETEASPEQKEKLAAYLGAAPSAANVHWEMVRLAMMSVCALAVIPMQDALGLDGSARMNHPAEATGNWAWRLQPGLATPDLAARLARLAGTYGRT
jgi:4-alpha-glucanotransferase